MLHVQEVAEEEDVNADDEMVEDVQFGQVSNLDKVMSRKKT